MLRQTRNTLPNDAQLRCVWADGFNGQSQDLGWGISRGPLSLTGYKTINTDSPQHYPEMQIRFKGDRAEVAFMTQNEVNEVGAFHREGLRVSGVRKVIELSDCGALILLAQRSTYMFIRSDYVYVVQLDGDIVRTYEEYDKSGLDVIAVTNKKAYYLSKYYGDYDNTEHAIRVASSKEFVDNVKDARSGYRLSDIYDRFSLDNPDVSKSMPAFVLTTDSKCHDGDRYSAEATIVISKNVA